MDLVTCNPPHPTPPPPPSLAYPCTCTSKQTRYLHILTISATLPAHIFLHQLMNTCSGEQKEDAAACEETAALRAGKKRQKKKKRAKRVEFKLHELAVNWVIAGSRLERPPRCTLPRPPRHSSPPVISLHLWLRPLNPSPPNTVDLKGE